MTSADNFGKHGFRPRFWLCAVATVLIVSIALKVAVASASLDESLLALGSRALAFESKPTAPAADMSVNGVRLSYRIETVAAPLSEAWKHYAERCARSTANASPFAALLRSLATRGRASKANGYVACVDLHRDDLHSFARAASAFAESGDLHELGSLRYVYLQSDSFDPKQTLVVAMWSDGPLDLKAFAVADEADTPGHDLDGVPRPVDAQRVLSVRLDRDQMAVYRVRARSPESQARWYVQALRSGAWRVIDAGDDGIVNPRGHYLVAGERGASTASVVVSRMDDGSTVVAAFQTESL